jgi:RNA recognition motif-containing protein
MASLPPDPYCHIVRVSNLSVGTDTKLLSNELEKFGAISWARVRIVDDELGRECKLGFVHFRDACGYQRALDFRGPIVVDGREVQIRPAKPPESSRDVAVVGQIPVGTSEQQIVAAFAEYNPIHIRVVAPEGQRPFAFLRLATEDDQVRLLRDARDCIEINGEKVPVRFARSLAIFPRMAQKRLRDIAPTRASAV